MEKETFSVWVAKYALTKGIVKEDGVHFTENKEYVSRAKSFGSGTYALFLKFGKDAFLTEAEAKARAVELGRAALKALEKKRKKVENLILREWA